MSQEDLIALKKAFINGDTSPLKDIYLEYKSDCLSFITVKRFTTTEKADGIFNEAILIFHNNILEGKIAELTSVKNYLISICTNLCKKEYRSENRFRKKMDEWRLLFGYQNNNISDSDDQRQLLMTITQDAMASMNEKCQKIISCFYLYQMKMSEIAEHLNLASSDVAKTLKSRCFKSLLKKVNELMKKS